MEISQLRHSESRRNQHKVATGANSYEEVGVSHGKRDWNQNMKWALYVLLGPQSLSSLLSTTCFFFLSLE